MKQGSTKYPPKSGQKGGEGEDQPSPRLEADGKCPNGGEWVGRCKVNWGRDYDALVKGGRV